MADPRQEADGVGVRVTRRGVLVTAAGAGLGAGLAGCGGGAGQAGSGYGAPPETTRAPAGPDGPELVRLADVPVGGATSVDDSAGNPVIVAQPRRGEVVAFSAVCTHRGCTVAPAEDGVLRCPCHGSTFDATTGDNTGGPAPEPLPSVPVSVVDGRVVEG
ncbi:MAG TPA: Rieske (2Fe-2S) protein [Nocardioidaceae bacterium]